MKAVLVPLLVAAQVVSPLPPPWSWHDPEVDFGALRTFEWQPSPSPVGLPPLVEARFVGSVEAELARRGLTRATDGQGDVLAVLSPERRPPGVGQEVLATLAAGGWALLALGAILTAPLWAPLSSHPQWEELGRRLSGDGSPSPSPGTPALVLDLVRAADRKLVWRNTVTIPGPIDAAHLDATTARAAQVLLAEYPPGAPAFAPSAASSWERVEPGPNQSLEEALRAALSRDDARTPGRGPFALQTGCGEGADTFAASATPTPRGWATGEPAEATFFRLRPSRAADEGPAWAIRGVGGLGALRPSGAADACRWP
jgi:hypothetical protein